MCIYTCVKITLLLLTSQIPIYSLSHYPQLREPLSLSILRQESCPRISAHDVITLCQLEYQALGYGGGARDIDPAHSLVSTSSPLLKRLDIGKKSRSGKGGRKGRRGVLVDIRSQEEYLVVCVCVCV